MGELDIKHFMHYFWLGRSSGNNKLLKSPIKKGKKVDIGKDDKIKYIVDEPVDNYKWLR